MISNERGFTLVEILVSLAIFAVVVIGALGVLGAAGVGGFVEGFPVGFVTARAARDITAATVYMQAFFEYASGQASSSLVPGSYCQGPVGGSCVPQNLASSGLAGCPGQPCPAPPTYPYQLNWQKLDVIIDRWYWDSVAGRYCVVGSPGCGAAATTEFLVHLRAILTWQSRGAIRPPLDMDRFLP